MDKVTLHRRKAARVVAAVPCPLCGAAVGEACHFTVPPRGASVAGGWTPGHDAMAFPHEDRYEAAEARKG